MKTLRDLCKRTFTSDEDFARAMGVHLSVAIEILEGKRHFQLSERDVWFMAKLFAVSLQECLSAANETYRWQMREAYPPYWRLQDRWRMEVFTKMQETKQKNEKKQKTQEQEDARFWGPNGYRDFTDRLFGPLIEAEALAFFGLRLGATREDVLAAFREKVKAAHKNGKFEGDMDDLVNKKERALKIVEGKTHE